MFSIDSPECPHGYVLKPCPQCRDDAIHAAASMGNRPKRCSFPTCNCNAENNGWHECKRLIEEEELTLVTGVKPSNPKDALGIAKVPFSTIPATVMAEVGIALLEGGLKYGRHNYRVIGVRASVYYDATVARHMTAWWEGEDIDSDSGLSHITKAIASLVVLRDAIIQGKFVDDRPPPSPPGWLTILNAKVKDLIAKYPNPVPAYTAEGERAKCKLLTVTSEE